MKKVLSHFLLFLGFASYGQDITIVLGPGEIAQNDVFTIEVRVSNERLRGYDAFPEIEGFRRRGTTSSTSTNIINGKRTFTQSLIQNYYPTSQGSFRIPPFTMEVNGQKISSKGKAVVVGAPRQRQSRRFDPFDPFDDLFGDRTPNEFQEVNDDAFFSVSTDKSEVYVGEGFTTTVAFYVSDKNRAELRFHELTEQLSSIIKKIKPANCWEENFNIEQINGEKVQLNGQNYSQYTIYKATFFPLNEEPIRIPEVGLKMVKYKVAKTRSFFGQNKQEDFKTFFSKAKNVKVKALPEHPLSDLVSVGDYRLEENASSDQLETGESFTYSFKVIGNGNISSIKGPEIQTDKVFDFYPPNSKQVVRRGGTRVYGSKSFSYYGIPKEPGSFDLSDYFSWIYFNVADQKYDTLKSDITLVVTGESKRNQSIQSTDLGSFYDGIEVESNELTELANDRRLRLFAYVFLFIMISFSGFIIFRR
jgi:hypothetical protein